MDNNSTKPEPHLTSINHELLLTCIFTAMRAMRHDTDPKKRDSFMITSCFTVNLLLRDYTKTHVDDILQSCIHKTRIICETFILDKKSLHKAETIYGKKQDLSYDEFLRYSENLVIANPIIKLAIRNLASETTTHGIKTIIDNVFDDLRTSTDIPSQINEAERKAS